MIFNILFYRIKEWLSLGYFAICKLNDMKKKYLSFFAIILFLFGHHFYAQSKSDGVETLLKNIRKLPLDTSQVRQLTELGYDLRESDSTLSKKILQESIDKSLKIKNKDAIANAYRFLGLWNSDFANYDNALENHRKSLYWANKNENLYYTAGAYFNIGNNKYYKGEYDSCIFYYQKVGKLYENSKILKFIKGGKKELDKRKSDLYCNMSMVFNTLKNLPKADEYIDKSIAIAQKYPTEKGRIALAYYMQQKADNYYENNQIKKALRIRLKNLSQLDKGQVNKSVLQPFYQNIAKEFLELKIIDSAKIFAQKSINLAEAIKMKSAIGNSNLLLANIALQENQPETAEAYLNKSKDYFIKSDDPTERRTFYETLHELLFLKGNYKEAYQNFKIYQQLNDTILASERSQQFSELEAKYESQKKTKEILQLEKKELKHKIFIYSLLGIVLGLLIFSYLLYRNYTARKRIAEQKITQLQQEKQIEGAQNMIQGEEAERTRLARDLHDGLGGMLTGIKFQLNTMKGNVILTEENALTFTKSILQIDNAITEMRRVAHNMMPENLLKFGLNDALQNYCDVISENTGLKIIYQNFGFDERLDQTTEIVLYRIIQELLNNTIKHANATQCCVQISKNDHQVNLTVEDNGKGFDVNAQKNGIGLANIQHRVDYLKGKLDIQSDEKGTSTHIEFEV